MRTRSVILSLVGLLCISLVVCSDRPVSTTAVTFQISSEGDLSIDGTRLVYPISQSALESLFGPPSRTKNTPYSRNLVWDHLGLMTAHQPSARGALLKIVFRLEGNLPDPDINPKLRFNGSIEVPAGTLDLNGPYIETDGYGFKEFMGDNRVVTMDIGGVEVMLIGMPFWREFGQIWLPASNVTVAGGLKICNKAKESTSVAFGQKMDGSWVTKGWYNLDRGECRNFATNISGKTYYFYAEGVRGSVWKGQYNLCIKPQKKFTITGFKNCEARGYKTVSFSQIEVPSGENEFTQNLTGG